MVVTEQKLRRIVLSPDRANPLAVRIANGVSVLIESGDLATGEKLPPTKRIAEILGVSTQSAHDALALLVSQGKLLRRPRVGTLVGNVAAQRTIGLLTKISPALPLQANFGWLIAQAFGTVAEARGHRHREYVVGLSGDESKLSECLVQDILDARLDVLMVAATPVDLVTNRFKSLPIPFTTPDAVEMDRGPGTASAVRWLARQGSRRLGFAGVPKRGDTLVDVFVETCRARGVATRPEWIISDCRSSIDYGRGLFGPLFGGPGEAPDGLIVLDDMIAFGLNQAMSQAGLDIPMAVQVNKGSRLHLPETCGLIEVDWQEIVDTIFGQIERGIYHAAPDDPRTRVPLRFRTPEEAGREMNEKLTAQVF